jgi:hypothetical protein
MPDGLAPGALEVAIVVDRSEFCSPEDLSGSRDCVVDVAEATRAG